MVPPGITTGGQFGTNLPLAAIDGHPRRTRRGTQLTRCSKLVTQNWWSQFSPTGLIWYFQLSKWFQLSQFHQTSQETYFISLGLRIFFSGFLVSNFSLEFASSGRLRLRFYHYYVFEASAVGFVPLVPAGCGFCGLRAAICIAERACQLSN